MDWLLDLVRDRDGPWSLVAVFLAAALEYLVPPLPADTIILAGSLLVVAGSYSFLTVAVTAIGGGFLGSLIHFLLGRWVSAEDGSIKGGPWLEKLTGKGSMDRFFGAFRRWGLWVILLNRAFPGVRAVTFFAAGAARLPLGRTLMIGLVSNIAWSLMILSLGVSIGANWEALEDAFRLYRTVVYAVGAVIFVVGGFWIWRNRQRTGPKMQPDVEEPD